MKYYLNNMNNKIIIQNKKNNNHICHNIKKIWNIFPINLIIQMLILQNSQEYVVKEVFSQLNYKMFKKIISKI